MRDQMARPATATPMQPGKLPGRLFLICFGIAELRGDRASKGISEIRLGEEAMLSLLLEVRTEEFGAVAARKDDFQIGFF